jgi:hypothetical protein
MFYVQAPAAVFGSQAATRGGHFRGQGHGLPALTHPAHPAPGEALPSTCQHSTQCSP